MNHESARRPLALALVCVAGVGLSACGDVESREAPESETAITAAPTVPAGTSMTFTLDEAISPEEHERGDEVTGTLTADVAGVEGGVVLDAGTKARWTVIESIGGDEEQAAGSLVALRLESVQLDDRWHTVQGTVTNVEPPSGATEQPGPEIAFGAEAETLIEQVKTAVPNESREVEEREETAGDTTRVGAEQGGGPIVAVKSDTGTVEFAAGSRVTVRLEDRLVLSGGYY